MKDITQQECSHCKETKLLDLFHKGSNKNGKRSWCKECVLSDLQLPHKRDRNIKRQNLRYQLKGKQETIDKKKSDIGAYLFTNAKSRAKERNEEFTIMIKDIIVPEICPLLNIKMQYNEGIKQDNSFSLDRIDSSKGYIPGNVWVVSLRANRIKNDSTVSELEQILRNLKNKIKSLDQIIFVE